MIKCFILFLSLQAFAHQHEPENVNLGTIPLHEYNLVRLEEKASYSLSYRQLPNWDGRLWDQTSLRARARVLPWLKLGAGYVWQKGARHNVDWVAPGWMWRDTRGRIEKLSQVEITPRILLAGAVWEWRQTLSYNDFTESTKLISRLGANFYNLKAGDQSLSFIVQAERHFPFTEKEATETWVYVLPFLNVNESLKIGPQAGYANFEWTSTEDFEDLKDDAYSVNEEFFFAGLRILNLF